MGTETSKLDDPPKSDRSLEKEKIIAKRISQEIFPGERRGESIALNVIE